MTADQLLSAYVAAPTPPLRDALIDAYHYLCRRGMRKFWRPPCDRRDLLQVAAIGLIKAVDYYRPALQTPFEAYAWMMIVGELMHYVRDHERLVRIPRSLRGLEKRYNSCSESLYARLGRAPRRAEIASEMGVSPEVVDQIRTIRSGSVVSIDDAASASLGESAAEHNGLPIEDRLTLQVALSALADRERAIVLGTFAAGLSQAEIGRRLGLSQSQISKLLSKALTKIQRAVA